MLLDSQGQVIVQSDGLSPSDRDSVIDQDLTAGRYSLVVESTGGTGAYALTTTVEQVSNPFQPIQLGSGPTSVVAGDFNGDGRTDLAVANDNDNTVSVLLGNGDGTFQPQVTYAVGNNPDAIVAGDFNGDGQHSTWPSSIRIHWRWSWSVSVLLGNGDGTFQPQVTYAVGIGPVPSWRVTSTATAASTWPSQTASDNAVSVLLGNGDGTFQPQVTYAVG